jgi:hypothetical protein
MSSDDKEEFLEVGKRLMEAFEEFDQNLRRHDRAEWERWKAGGKAVSDDFISMYPSAEGIINTISETEPEDGDEDEEEPFGDEIPDEDVESDTLDHGTNHE